MFHSVSFDFSVWEIGARCLRRTSRDRSARRSRSARALPRDAQGGKGERAQSDAVGVPVIDQESDSGRPPLNLRFVVLGGEALDVRMLAPWFMRYGDERVAVVNIRMASPRPPCT